MLQRYSPASLSLILMNTLSLYLSAAILIPINLTDIIFFMTYVSVCVKMYYKRLQPSCTVIKQQAVQPNAVAYPNIVTDVTIINMTLHLDEKELDKSATII